MDAARKAVLSLTPHKGSPFTDPACVHRLYVGDFDECLSDIHCPVFIKLKTATDSHETIHNVNVSQGLSTVTEALLLGWKKHFCT